MNKAIPVLLIALALSITSFITFQYCEGIIFTKGASYEMEHYSKDKKVSISKMLVTDVTTNGSEKTSTIQSESYTLENVKDGSATFKIICSGDNLKIDLKSAASSKLANNPNFDISMEDAFMEFPVNPKVGQSIADNQIKMTVKNKKTSAAMGDVTMSFVNRKVVSKEKITTPAGTFDCFKVTADIKGQMNMMGTVMPMPASKTVSYYNNQVGMVKSETYDDKAALVSSEILSKYKKP